MSSSDPKRLSKAGFASTHWSVVVAAGGASSPAARLALATLCETYWYPLYAFVRSQGYDSTEAHDLTQEFFCRLLEKEEWRDVHPERGKFRSFLLACLRHFLANERDKARAAKRGGGRTLLSVDTDLAESRYGQEPAHQRTPERVFDKRWALTVLDQVFARLRQEWVEAGKVRQFDSLKDHLTGDKTSASYRELAEQLHMSEGAVKVAIHRLRCRFADVLRSAIAETVAGPEKIDEEIRDLFDALRQ